jgi:UDP-N-acetylmuramyl pentapeptide synthase
MGCSSFGEIARLAELFKPRAGVITNIGDAHLELLGDRNGVARAKGELAAALPKDGLLLLWGEDPYAGTLAKFGDPLTQVRTFGFGDGNLLKLEDLGPDGAGRRMRVEGKELRLPSPMHHAILQAGAAWLLAREYGAEVQDLAEALEAAQPEGNRSSLYRIGDWIFMDDSYNANPDSLRAALRWLAETPCEGRRWALLGDMLEMGPGGENVHREMGREVAQMGGIGLMTLGPLAAAMTEGGETAGLEIAQKFENHTSLATALLEKLGKGDVILVKGSRGMEMEKIIEIMENATGLSRKAIR